MITALGNLKSFALLALLGLAVGCNSSEEETEIVADPNASQSVQEPPPTAAELRLNLKEGDRFPLVKTVEQVLLQPADQGIAEVRSSLELLLELKVEKVTEEGMKLVSVKYHRVKYQHNLGGTQVSFNSSEQHSEPLPPDVQTWFGLVNNGFSFWLGPDNRVMQTNDFHKFLQQCVSQVPEDQRQKMYEYMEASAGNDGIANFIDDCIGLLPYSTSEKPSSVAINDGWTRKRIITGPVPMNLETTFLLQKLDPETAEVDITGNITPVKDEVTIEKPNGVKVTLIKGETLGHCTLERETGLPRHSEVLRTMDLKVESSGQTYVQKKRITTRLETYTEPLHSQPLHIGNPAAQNPPAPNSSVNTN